MGRGRARVPPTKGAPMPVAVEAASVLIVPAFPMFSQAAGPDILAVSRSTVHKWLGREKLGFIMDNLGERYVLRDELIRFATEYLKLNVKGVH